MNINSTNVSLELAKRLSETVNSAWESGELMEWENCLFRLAWQGNVF